MTATLADYEWLTSDAAAPHLKRRAKHAGDLTRLVTALRKEFSAERAHLLIEQTYLRRRARDKFRRADEMFFTRKGMEQATDEQIATYKASRIQSFPFPAADLCCGIGGDLLALSRVSLARGTPALGVDLDPITAHLARENHQRLLGSAANIVVQDAQTIPLDDYGLIHVDPDRRSDGARHTRFEDLVPGGEFLEQHAQRALAIKLAPATEVPPRWAAIGEREWIGSRGECRQQVLWLGPLTITAGRAATIVGGEGQALITVREDPEAALEPTQEVKRFLYEPHAAMLAAQLAPTLAATHSLQSLTPEGGYLTGDAPFDDPALACFEVLEVLPFDSKRIKRYLRVRNIGRLEIKKRGISDVPELIRTRLDLRGNQEATLILTRRGERTIAIMAQRMG